MPLYRINSSERLLVSLRSTGFGDHYDEKVLEDWLEANPAVLVGDETLLVIGRQVNTPVGVVDLLALDSDAATVTIELKRAPSQRQAVAQTLEYAAYLSSLSAEAIEQIAVKYLTRNNPAGSLEEAWRQSFNSELPREALNRRQRLFVVIEGEDERLASLVRFLRRYNLEITLLRYNYYRSASGEEILDLEREVGEDEVVAASSVAGAPTEPGLVSGWSQDSQTSYSVIRQRFVSAGLSPKPKKSGISFSKQSKTGRVFVCLVSSSDHAINVWLRSDSLAQLFDMQAVAEAVRRKVETEAEVKHTPVWLMLKFPASPEAAGHIADVLLEEVVARIV